LALDHYQCLRFFRVEGLDVTGRGEMLRATRVDEIDPPIIKIVKDRLRIAIVGQDTMSSSLLATLIKKDLNCEAIGARPSELVALISGSPMDVVVINADINTKAGAGYELAATVSEEFPDVRLVMLISHPSREATIAALRAGACGIFNRQEPISQFVDCIKHVRDGSIWAGPMETRFLLDALKELPALSVFSGDPSLALSARELQVVRYAARGKTNREIAVELRLSEHTVKNYLFRAFDKLGVSSRGQLLFYLATKADNAKPPKAGLEEF
jgi:two-component system, NarL family, nitrate/nitrite response regulator NarL